MGGGLLEHLSTHLAVDVQRIDGGPPHGRFARYLEVSRRAQWPLAASEPTSANRWKRAGSTDKVLGTTKERDAHPRLRRPSRSEGNSESPLSRRSRLAACPTPSVQSVVRSHT